VTELDRSRAWWARAEAVIPLGTQTLSKSPTQFVQGVSPIFLERALGAHVWDVDGNEYIDYPMALGPVLLGYRDPRVNAAVRAQLEAGITFTLMHPLEVEVAERIVAMCPGVEAVRFGKTGSDAVSGAVRAARAITGRDHVVALGYHGWHDWYIGATTRDLGVPDAVQELTRVASFGDLDALAEVFRTLPDSIAAVVLEPAGVEVPAPGYLQAVVDLAHDRGALVVFDEIITGFRVAPGGARERYGVNPDLSCYGKALGNGMPISAVAGDWDTMRVFEQIFFSGTHGGETLSLAAAATVLDVIADGTVLKAMEERGLQLRDGIAALIDRHGANGRVRVSGEPHRSVVSFSGADHLVVKSWVQQCLIEQGVLFNGSMFVCEKHDDEDVDRTLRAFDTAFAALGDGADVRDLLKGPPVQPVFREL
jgi:glutamate-1-semialdehyde aminotransferase